MKDLARREQPRVSRPLVAVIVVVLVVAATFGGWYWLEGTQRSSKAPIVRGDGPTFYQALASLNSSVTNETGGPWSIFSVMGIAAQGPYSPSVKGYVVFNASLPVNGCQAALNGLTMFNGSIPSFTGTFNSGTAPFWQFAYYSNTTGEVLVGTNVLGTAYLFTPFPLDSNCTHGWGDFGLDPTKWTDQIYSNTSLPPDSSLAAGAVWSNIDTGYLNSHQPLVELFTSGPAMLAATQDIPDGRLGVDFVSCGLAGFTGYNTGWAAGYGMAYYSGVNKNGSYAGVFNATTNCYVGNTATVPGAGTGAYQLFFSNVTASTSTDTTRFTASTAVNFALTSGGEYSDMWGLANWMTNWNLTTPSDSRLPLGMPECASWVPSVEDCVANSSGWFVVLLSASGEWLNSYGSIPGGGIGWSEPITALVSHQQLVVVVPSGWNVSGDQVSPASTIATSTVTGGFIL
ncbi:MAG: hypothetical protein WBE40_03215 [Thermoplasmata archaeon]